MGNDLIVGLIDFAKNSPGTGHRRRTFRQRRKLDLIPRLVDVGKAVSSLLQCALILVPKTGAHHPGALCIRTVVMTNPTKGERRRRNVVDAGIHARAGNDIDRMRVRAARSVVG